MQNFTADVLHLNIRRKQSHLGPKPFLFFEDFREDIAPKFSLAPPQKKFRSGYVAWLDIGFLQNLIT